MPDHADRGDGGALPAHAGALAADATEAAVDRIIEAIERAGHAAGPEMLNDAGVSLAGRGRMVEAIGCYGRALRLRPDYPLALNNLGLALRQVGRIEAAIDAHRRAVALDPSYADGQHGLASALAELGRRWRDADRLDDALAAHSRAAALGPADAEVLNQLGITQRERNDLAAAIDCFRRAAAAQPAHVGAHVNLAMALLATGDFAAGCPEYEWRLRHGPHRPPVAAPLWDGRPLGAGTLLLCAEQGLGDTIQFVRYAPALRARAGRILVACPPPLVRLLAGAPGIDGVVPIGQPLPAVDAYLPLLSVMHRLGADPARLPAAVPYLRAAPAPGALAGLLAGAGPRIGLVWRGNPHHPNDRRRSLPLALLRPLLALRGLRFFSLQLGAPASEAADAAAFGVIDLAPQLRDFADTAAAMSALDLVITIDSAAAHLAGALGRPCWVMLPFSADWRWLDGRDDSPWYPTLRLFRQPRCGEWSPAIDRLAAEATRRFAGDSGGGANPPAGRSAQFCH